jgi:hypothetical protein
MRNVERLESEVLTLREESEQKERDLTEVVGELQTKEATERHEKQQLQVGR